MFKMAHNLFLRGQTNNNLLCDPITTKIQKHVTNHINNRGQRKGHCMRTREICGCLSFHLNFYLFAQFKRNKCGFVLTAAAVAHYCGCWIFFLSGHRKPIRNTQKIHKIITMMKNEIKHRFTNADNKMFRL